MNYSTNANQTNSPNIHYCSNLSVWSSQFQMEKQLENETILPVNSECNKVIFNLNENINEKIALWNGNMLRLQVDAMVHPTNEHFERCSPLSRALYNEAGPQLRKCLYNKFKYCPIGSVRISKGYEIVPRYIIHTASPHYQTKYHSASEMALFNCYFHVLQAAKYYNLQTLAIGNLALPRHNYSHIDAIHLGIRVIRRFLESFPSAFKLIVFCTENECQYNLYQSLLKLYFPRNEREQLLANHFLPNNIGGVMGEPIIPERAIRIKENPIKIIQEINDSGLESDSYSSSYSTDYGSEINVDECRERLIELNYQQEFSCNESANWQYEHETHNGFSSFAMLPMIGGEQRNNYLNQFSHRPTSNLLSTVKATLSSNDNVDKFNHCNGINQSNLNHQYDQFIIDQHKRQLKYERLLRRTKLIDKQASNSIKARLNQAIFISKPGQQGGQPALFIVGRALVCLLQDQPLTFDSTIDFILVHLIRLLNKLTHNGHSEKYVVIYLHTTTLLDNFDLANKTRLLSRLYELITYHHRKCLQSFYIINPSVFNRVYVWWLKTFYCKFLKNKIHFVRSISQLKNIVDEEHIDALTPLLLSCYSSP